MGPHFSEQAFDFLEELEHRNNREWFQEHKPVYETELKAPMLEVIEAINAGLSDIAPDYVRPPAKAMLRIYRDVRFSNDKTPYKTHLAASWPRQGLEKAGGAGFFLQVGVHGVMVAGGAYSPGPAQLRAIREYLLEHHAEVRALLTDATLTGLAEPFDGRPLLRAPRGFDAEHPAADLLRVRSWAQFALMPGDAALNADFVDRVLERFRALAPFIELLNVVLAAATPLAVETGTGRRRAAGSRP
ncbi:DUF2461 domain-containing protein [Cryobacterium sp. 1639]|uniref:DUF2461 domain-containing protein n=1 Tax=Cryobacterium inferilacus TaxID=2866629 RepID=UPI001C73BDE6|nr:DUF2461 domain-containing protein [Cryobacterium sp. 1639]MBX0300167.1 DUF2461 domain-containing protein [Cryobacterium sp. 1639]